MALDVTERAHLFRAPIRIPYHDSATIAVVSDLQRTALIERMMFLEQNDPERAGIIRSIAQSRANIALLLGDHVFLGASEAAWAFFDDLVEPLRGAGIELFPILGNHDCWSIGPRALNHYFRRFPRIEGRRFYTATFGPLGIVALDSNKLFMPARSWQDQIRFHEQAMAAFDADPEVRGVLVLVHHPPFTNGTVTGPSALVERTFAPFFHRSRKGMLMLSGHVHAYEHFLHQGRHYVVCGGGGGPRHRLLQAGKRRLRDLFDGPSIRDFHFLSLDPTKDGLEVRVTGLVKGETRPSAMDAFQIDWQD